MPTINGEKYFAHFQSEAAGEFWRFRGINLTAVVESFGCAAIRAETPEEVKDALAGAFMLDRPVIIDVAADINAFARRASSLTRGIGHGH